MGSGVCLSVRLSVCRMHRPNSRAKRPIESLKLARRKPISHGYIRNLFRRERSKVKLTKSTNAITDNASYARREVDFPSRKGESESIFH